MSALALAASLSFAASGAQAADCDAEKAGGELTGDEAQAVYECLKESLQAGYAEGDKHWIPAEYVTDYPGWTPASAFPADGRCSVSPTARKAGSQDQKLEMRISRSMGEPSF